MVYLIKKKEGNYIGWNKEVNVINLTLFVEKCVKKKQEQFKKILDDIEKTVPL